MVWDATSIAMLQECPRKYQLAQIEGWRSLHQSIDLRFGGATGDALETYYKSLLEDGAARADALRHAVRRLLELCWNAEKGESHFGLMQRLWHCTGTEPYRNEKGNKAKCPFSHKGKFFLAPAPSVCGKCGSTTAELDQWLPYNAVKDTAAALRQLVWYADDSETSPLRPLTIPGPEGQPIALVEVPWTVPVKQIGEHTFSLAGWFDGVKMLGEGDIAQAFITDYKTTKHTLGASYWAGYWPNTQVGVYDMVADALMRDRLPYAGVAIEAFQLLKGGVRTGFRTFTFTGDQRAEFREAVASWLSLAYAYHEAGRYPMNPTACKLCAFKQVCAASPHERPALLREHFKRERWNPMTRTSEPLEEPTCAPAKYSETPSSAASDGPLKPS